MAKLNGYLMPIISTLVGVLVTVLIFNVRSTNAKAEDNQREIVDLRISNGQVITTLEDISEDISEIKDILKKL